jgi:uncharacterized protein (TIGR03437 family)
MSASKALRRAGCACLMASLTGAWAQPVPSINSGGVINAASSAPGAPLAPGSIASAYGNFLIAAPSVAAAVPLPGSLEGLSLAFGATGAPLFYASGTQVNLQIPWELAGQSQASLTASLAGQTSSPATVNIAPFAPGIFSMNGQGFGPGAIQDSSYQLITASNPAGAGATTILIYCTGLGAVTNPPQTGAAAPSNPLAATKTTPTVTIGNVPAQVLWSGLAPGSVGLYQVNVAVPANAPIGDAIPVILSIGGATSNTVSMAVQPPTPDQRADQLITQMTQDQEIQLVYGAIATATVPTRGGAGFVAGIPALGIPNLYLADGSVGVGNGVGQATALPSSIASAASWDVNEAYKYGTVIGAELRAYGMNVNLGGNINLIGREPRDGRTFETKGEDPILAGKITAAHINAIQAQHVIGGIKHYALNDQESGRTTADAEIDERGMRESDLLAFEIGAKDSNVQSVMCAYNLVNDVYNCENAHLLNDILKGDWQFPGFVMSDWGATHSTVNAALNGSRSGAAGQRLLRKPGAGDRERPGAAGAPGRHGASHPARDVRGRTVRLSGISWADRYSHRPSHRARGRGAGRGAVEERRRAVAAECRDGEIHCHYRIACRYRGALRRRLGAGHSHRRTDPHGGPILARPVGRR